MQQIHVLSACSGGLYRAPFGPPMRSTAKQPRRSDEQRDEEPVQGRKL